jgi:hypothetical protein
VISILSLQESGTRIGQGDFIVNLRLPLISASVMSIRSLQKSRTAASLGTDLLRSPIRLSRKIEASGEQHQPPN